jgi:hypothetical protein
MLTASTYTKAHADACRSKVALQVSAYRNLVPAAAKSVLGYEIGEPIRFTSETSRHFPKLSLHASSGSISERRRRRQIICPGGRPAIPSDGVPPTGGRRDQDR